MNIRVTVAAIAAVVAASATVDAAPRVHHGVHRALRETGKANIVVTMKTKPTEALQNFESATFATRGFNLINATGEKIETMVKKLDSLAQESQKGIDQLLSQEAGDAEPLFEKQYRSWASNSRLFNGATFALVEKLASLPDIDIIREQEVEEVSNPEAGAAAKAVQADTIQWGVERIQATNIWAEGNIGQNVVVGVIDTGVRGTHEVVRDSMRESYNWYDPDFQTDFPYDPRSHGTHVMGTITGAKGYGVAPGAKWMACLGCPDGCPEFNLVTCAEFMICPTDTKGQNKDCSKAPSVINNSWGGAGGRTWFRPYVDAWRQAEIIPVFSQGNSGPNCSSAGSPGDFPNVIGVGATSQNETLAYFSGRGPSLSGLMKPDLSAPGLFILSSTNTSDTDIVSKSGTSMAAPHVTGAIALLLSRDPTLKYDQVLSLLTSTTDQSNFNSTLSNDRGGLDTCGGIKETVFPNYHYGTGRMNVFSAYQGARATVAPTPAPTTA